MIIFFMMCSSIQLFAQEKTEKIIDQKEAAKQFSNAQFTSMVINADNKRFGYYILVDGQIYIEQKNIPGVSGNNGFISEDEAKRTSDLAIYKMKHGEIPPTISIDDLIKMKITLEQ